MEQVVPRIVYVKLINLHIEAMATFCFLSSGENKCSVSHEVYCINANLSPCESTMHDKPSFLKMDSDNLKDLKAAVRSSFAMLVRKPLELHLFLALQSIERALAGIRPGHNTVSELHTGSLYGGKVGRIVAAGVECLDLALESVSGMPVYFYCRQLSYLCNNRVQCYFYNKKVLAKASLLACWPDSENTRVTVNM